MASTDLERAIDRHIAGRLRATRLLRGVSQTQLGAAMGVTFQQVQKFENASNRISAARLLVMARALDVSLSYFFEGLDEPPSEEVGHSPRLTLEVARTMALLPRAQQLAISHLVRSLAGAASVPDHATAA